MEFEGYGIDLYDRMDDVFPGLLAFTQKYTPDIYKELCESMDPEDDEEDRRIFVKEWFSEYDSNGYSGLSAYLRDVINEQEGTQFRSFDIDCYCIYFPQDYPWNLNEKMRGMSMEEFCGIVRKYLNQITDAEYTFANIEMCDS